MTLGIATQTESAIHVLGVRFNTLTTKQAVEQILHWIDQKSRRMVITAGPEFVMMARQNKEVMNIVKSADLVTPDGIGVVWAANRRQKRIIERVTGVELVRELFNTASERRQSLRVYILGATESSLCACLEEFDKLYPGFELRGRNGFFSESEWPEIQTDIASFQPDVWLVGTGQPRQEKLIYQSLGALPPCVAIGVGGSIDIWGNTVKRAPAVFRKFNVEWMYRLLTQPSRWRRQLALPKFAWQVLRTTEKAD